MIAMLSPLNAALRSPLLPLLLVIGLLPFGRSAELGTLLCLLGVGWALWRRGLAPFRTRAATLLAWLLAAYIAAAALSAVDSFAPAKSWGAVAGYLRYLPLGLYACMVLRRAPALHAAYTGVALLVVLWAVDAWVQALTGWSLGGAAEAERVSGIFGADNLKLGPTLAVLSPFALWLAWRRFGQVGWLVAVGVLLVPILLAGSRAAWLMYALVVLAFAWHALGAWRRFAWFCAAGVLTLAVVTTAAWQVSGRFQARAQRTMLALPGHGQALDTALSGRLDIWRTTVHMVADHPWNGVGVRAYRFAYPQYAAADDHFVVAESCGVGEGACHAHQLLLEIASETGGIGLALWLLALAGAVRAWRVVGAAARRQAFPATLALGVMLFPLNTHLAFYSAWWGLLFAWLLGLWCAALWVPVEDVEATREP